MRNREHKKLWRLIVSLFIVFCLSSGLNAQVVQNSSYNLMLKALLSHNVTEIGAKEAKVALNVMFIDAREKKEYDVSHIKGAVWCGYDDFDFTRVKQVQKDKPVIVYCSVGYRSEKVTEKLIAAGYKNVKNLVGGIFEWKNLGYEVFDLQGNETDKIHAFSKTWGIWLNKGVKVYN